MNDILAQAYHLKNLNHVHAFRAPLAFEFQLFQLSQFELTGTVDIEATDTEEHVAEDPLTRELLAVVVERLVHMVIVCVNMVLVDDDSKA